MRRFGVVAVLLTAVWALAMPGVAAATVTPKTALTYGDSITWESNWETVHQFAGKTGWTFHLHAYPGTAVCDWLPWLADDLATFAPSVVGIETAGNWFRPCMIDANGNLPALGSPAFLAKYQANLATFFATVTATGAKVVFIQSPPMLDSTRNAAITRLNVIARSLAANYHGVSIATGPRNAVSASGKYVAVKPCLTIELTNPSCGQAGPGLIDIRTIVGIQTGLHFCPDGLQAGYPYPCDVYSSGEYRFGRALANTLVAPPPPILI